MVPLLEQDGTTHFLPRGREPESDYIHQSPNDIILQFTNTGLTRTLIHLRRCLLLLKPHEVGKDDGFQVEVNRRREPMEWQNWTPNPHHQFHQVLTVSYVIFNGKTWKGTAQYEHGRNCWPSKELKEALHPDPDPTKIQCKDYKGDCICT